MIQLLILGFAVSGDIIRVPASVTDLDNSSASRSLVSHFENTKYLDVKYRPNNPDESNSLLQKGDTIVSVTIPKNFERDLVRGETPELSVVADAQNTNVALSGVGYVSRITGLWTQSQDYSPSGMSTAAISSPVETRIWYNPELKSVYNMIPGIIVLLVSIITIMITALSIVKERGEANTLEQLIVTPITRLELILGKSIPFAILGIVVLTITLIFAKLIYGIPFEGPVLDFYLMTIVFLFCSIGVGIFVSTITSTQQQALFTAWFFMIFFILMSGFFMPLENMPKVLYYITFLDPVRYYLEIVRDLFIKGSGLRELWGQTLALSIWAVIILTAAVTRFHKKLD